MYITEYMKKWAKENAEYLKEYKKNYYIKNREYII